MTLLDRMAEWPEQWRREGVEEGRQEGMAEGRREGVVEGRREGIARERALLRRLATLRFGGSVAGEVAVLLERTEDWDTLTAVGELIVGAETDCALTDDADKLIRSTD